ncbi:hypothetical protein OAJ78_00335 [Gammaproteobacteria bacterium]|nr:hypothetical protein [Gammaproteobacteria bacterium]
MLVEANRFSPNHIAERCFIEALANGKPIKVYAYDISERGSFRDTNTLAYYKATGIEVLKPKLTAEQDARCHDIVKRFSSLISNQEIFDITIDGVWVGDLITDTELLKERIPTVDPQSPSLKNRIRLAVKQIIYWNDFFSTQSVAAVCSSHACYLGALPLRVAIAQGVPAVQVNAHTCYRLTSTRKWAYSSFHDYRDQFRQLTMDARRHGRREARSRLNERFAGVVGVDMPYSSKTAFGRITEEQVLSTTPKFKILIALHCFFDSPNGMGINLFVDFYQWLLFLGEISNQTDYEWYLKTHPDSLPGNNQVIQGLLEKFPKFKLIPRDTSHHQLIQEGIGCVLTMHGTVGVEYAALGRLVVHASLVNPHIAYNFNLHPKSIAEYRKILMNLSEVKLKISQDEVEEFYFMHYLVGRKQLYDGTGYGGNKSWIYNDLDEFIESIGPPGFGPDSGYQKSLTSTAYQKFIEEWSPRQQARRVQLLRDFVGSKSYQMRWNSDFQLL